MKSAARWLDRRVAVAGPYLQLCLSSEEFYAALKYLKIVERPADWLKAGSHGRTWIFQNPKGESVALVCLGYTESATPLEIAGLLVHEAVHVWQDYVDSIGETAPGTEQEAYAIQSIAQTLMAEYARRIAT